MSSRARDILCGAFGFLVVALPCGEIAAQTTIGDVRDQLREELDSGAFAALVSGFVSIDLLPQVSSGTFYTDNPDPSLPDNSIDTFKLPLRFETQVADLPGRMFLGGGLGYLKSHESIRVEVPINGIPIPSRIDSINEAYNGMGTVGWTFGLGKGFGLRPMFGFAYSEVHNEGRYDAVGNILWKPILDGIVLNWDLKAFTLSAGANLLYRQEHGWGRIEGDLNFVHTWTRIFDASDPVQEGEIQNDFLASRLDFVYCTGQPIAGCPLDLRLRYGLFHVLGNDDALGFTSLLETGLGAELDLAGKGHPLSRIGFMGSVFVGQRTRGWTVGLTFEL